MIDIWQRELEHTKQKPMPSIFAQPVFIVRMLSRTERYIVRARAFVLLQKRTDYEKTVDMLLREFDFLAWHQVDELATDAKRVLRKI